MNQSIQSSADCLGVDSLRNAFQRHQKLRASALLFTAKALQDSNRIHHAYTQMLGSFSLFGWFLTWISLCAAQGLRAPLPSCCFLQHKIR